MRIESCDRCKKGKGGGGVEIQLTDLDKGMKCVYMGVHVRVCVYVHLRVHVHVYVRVHVHVYVRVHVHVYLYACTYV